MRTKIVTTCHLAGWEEYGQKCLNGLKYWPEDAEIVWYTEGFDLPKNKRVRGIRNETLPLLQGFKERHKSYVWPDWRYDVVRFCNKIYAVHDALYNHDGLGVWMDADIVANKRMPKGYLESLLPEDCYIALFQRDGMHSECGLWLVNGQHSMHKPFMNAILDMYEKDNFKKAHEWHDSVLMDVVVRAFERDGLFKSHNLSGQHKDKEHPMAVHDIAKYVDHLKGPSRKHLGRSPERKAA